MAHRRDHFCDRQRIYLSGIERDIAGHAALSQQVMQLANIISESVKKLPAAPSINR
jgi:hypothetical protein